MELMSQLGTRIQVQKSKRIPSLENNFVASLPPKWREDIAEEQDKARKRTATGIN